MMKEQIPEKAAEKLKERRAELEKIELKKILDEKEAKKEAEKPSTSSAQSGKREIPPHILAKIRAKQAAKVITESYFGSLILEGKKLEILKKPEFLVIQPS